MPDINYGEILEALNDKVDLSGSWSAPNGQYDDLSGSVLNMTNASYSITAPADGWFFAAIRSAENSQFLGCYNDQLFTKLEMWAGAGAMCYILLPMKKGQVLSDIRTTCTGTDKIVRFIYAQKTN